MSLDNIVQLTEANITAAKEHLAEIEAARGLLQKAGMYPAAPHFQWQRREELGEARYLYLMFHKNEDGIYQGPDGKRKIYIGADPEKIADAKRKTRNFELWHRLGSQAHALKTWVSYAEAKIKTIEQNALILLADSQKFPKAELVFID